VPYFVVKVIIELAQVACHRTERRREAVGQRRIESVAFEVGRFIGQEQLVSNADMQGLGALPFPQQGIQHAQAVAEPIAVAMAGEAQLGALPVFNGQVAC